mgnify:CR=1 FL=1
MLPDMPASLRRIVVVLVLLALYVAGGAYSSLLRGGPDEVALFWPAAGIGLAGVLRYGLRVAWFVPLGTLLVHLLFEPVPRPFIVWSMASNFLGVLAGAWLMRRQPMDDLLTVRFGLHALGGSLVMATVSALIGTAGMFHAGMILAEQLPASAGRWLLGDLLGATSIAPAVMLLLPGRTGQRRRFPDSEYASETERLGWNIALMASYLLMAWGGSLGGNYAMGLVALPLGVMVWSAVRLPPRFTAIASALTMLLIAGLAGFGTAGYPRAADPLDSLYLLVFLVEVAALPLMLAFAMHQQRVAAGVLKHRANIDPLTGLDNRNAFEEGMRPVLTETSTVPMALAYLDLDHLKLINDTASHAAGDQLIRGVAGVVSAHMRPEDRVARTGGDEFALLLRNCTPMVAEDRARTLLRAIEGYRCGWDGRMLATTASVGLVACVPGQGDYAQLLSQADAACFTAKEQGGNRVCLASLDGGELLDRTAAMRDLERYQRAYEGGAVPQNDLARAQDLMKKADIGLAADHRLGRDLFALEGGDRLAPAKALLGLSEIADGRIGQNVFLGDIELRPSFRPLSSQHQVHRVFVGLRLADDPVILKSVATDQLFQFGDDFRCRPEFVNDHQKVQ